MKVAVIGHTGTVGRCLFGWLKGQQQGPDGPDRWVRGYSLDDPGWDWTGASLVFVCVPTPNGPEPVCEVVQKLASHPTPAGAPHPIVVVKSTVPPGTCSGLDAAMPTLRIYHSPEFLSARTAWDDFLHPVRQIVGGPDRDVCRTILGLLPPAPRQIACSSSEAEILKYMHNVFGALMVVYSNLFADICAGEGEHWPVVSRDAASEWLPAETLQRYGTIWNDLQRGYGGTCFPKDVKTLLEHCGMFDIDADLLRGLVAHNDKLRAKGAETWIPEHGGR